MDITFKILLESQIRGMRGRHEVSLIELHPDDFAYCLTELLAKHLANISTFRRYGADVPILSTAYDEALKIGKFLFRDSIVIPNLLVEKGSIRTFNKDLFESKEYSFDELQNKKEKAA